MSGKNMGCTGGYNKVEIYTQTIKEQKTRLAYARNGAAEFRKAGGHGQFKKGSVYKLRTNQRGVYYE